MLATNREIVSDRCARSIDQLTRYLSAVQAMWSDHACGGL
jgi:hypothetical protein